MRKQKEKRKDCGFSYYLKKKKLNEEFIAAQQELAVDLWNIKKSFYELDRLVKTKIF